MKAYLANTPERSEWPSHAGARDWLGRLYEAEGKRTAAVAQYQEALRLDPRRKLARERINKLVKSSD